MQDKEFAEAAAKNRFVKPEAMRDALAEAERTGKSLPDVLVEHGLLTPALVERINEIIAESKRPPTLGNFELISKVAEGGMGAVYRARQVSLDRIVALKLLPQRLSHDEQFVARFLREAKVAAKLNHPNIVMVHEAGTDRGRHYFAMEFIEGQSVGDVLKERGLFPEKEALRIVREVARALEYAREHNMIHRDVKPDNILLTEDGTPKLADLGLARSTLDDSTRMTQSGLAMGTPHYISPEQARGETDLDIRTDIYSLGATLYHMATGKTPFSGTTAAVVITKHLTESPPAANEVNPDVSEETAAVVAKMMARKRDERYATPAEVIEELERVQLGEKPKALLGLTLAGLDAKELEELIELRKRETGELRAVAPLAAKRRAGLWIAAAVGGALAVGILALAVFGPGRRGPERGPDEIAASIERLLGEDKLTEALAEAQAARALFPGDPRFIMQEERVREAKAEKERKRALEEQASREMAAIESLVASKQFQAALEKAIAAKAAYSDTTLAERFASFEADVRRELQRLEAARAAEEERKKKEREYARLVALGDESLGKKAFPEAISSYEKARALRDTEKVRSKLAAAQFGQEVALGEKAEKERKLADALAHYRSALEAKKDEETAERVERLRRGLEARGALKSAEDAFGRGELARAKTEAGLARPGLPEADLPRLEELLKRIEIEQAYRTCVARAQKALRARAWYDVRSEARAALGIKPADKEARSLVEQAEEQIAVVNSVGMKLVLVPAGTYKLGSNGGEADEAPAHEVELSAFYLGATEVTNAQYERFRPGHRQKRPSDYSRGDADPAVHVTWKDATDFCIWLSRRERRSYRLPTEAEWEAAARGTDGRVYPWGNEAPDADGDFRANLGWGGKSLWPRDGSRGTARAGSFPKGASPFGCLDMCGNVWEWCLDRYSRDHYSVLRARARDPRGPRSGEARVLKGGGFESDARAARASARGCQRPTVRGSLYGFRVALEGR